MGLNCTHGAWDGAYSRFSRFRQAIAAAIGFNLDDMVGFGGDVEWATLPPDPLHVLLNHSDCDGVIEVADLLPLARRLQEVAPLLTAEDFRERAVQFAAGCRNALVLGDVLEFR